MFKIYDENYKVVVLNRIHNLLSYICSLYTVGNISSVTKESFQATLKIKAAHFFQIVCNWVSTQSYN